MATYMATINWRGALNIGEMRTFDTEEAAWQYAKTINTGGTLKVYELFSDKEPRLCKKPK